MRKFLKDLATVVQISRYPVSASEPWHQSQTFKHRFLYGMCLLSGCIAGTVLSFLYPSLLLYQTLVWILLIKAQAPTVLEKLSPLSNP